MVLFVCRRDAGGTEAAILLGRIIVNRTAGILPAWIIRGCLMVLFVCRRDAGATGGKLDVERWKAAGNGLSPTALPGC